VMNISDAQADFSEEVYRQLKKAGIRTEKDLRNEKLNYKIRQAQLLKIPFMLIIGDKEVEEQRVTVRLRDGQNLPAMSIDELIEMLKRESRIPISSE